MPSRRAWRALWSDPWRKIRTLGSFSRTEEDGGLDLRAAAGCVSDPQLRRSLLMHADDERRHAELFRRRANELSALSPALPADDTARPYDLVRGRSSVETDAHGFFTAGLCDEMGDVAYIAMLHVAEQRAAALFEQHRAALDDDPATRAIFEEILRDEKFHVSYTGSVLKRWRSEGRSAEVKDALRRARDARFLGAWKRLGLRSAGTFGRAVLWAFYWTLLVPFALFARRREAPVGWRAPLRHAGADPLRSQY